VLNLSHVQKRLRERAGAGWLGEYDVRLELLPQKAVNLEAFALRKDERISRRFLPSMRHELTQTGLTLRWDNKTWPMELTVLTLDDRIEFGSEHQHVLQTLFEYEEDRGDLPRDHLTVVPQLTLQYSDWLSTRYRYEFSRDRFDSFLLRSNRFDFEATHRLGDYLTTTGGLHAWRETSDEGLKSNNYGGNVRFSYRRENRLGIFSGTLGYNYDYRSVRHGKRFATAADEQVFSRIRCLATLRTRM